METINTHLHAAARSTVLLIVVAHRDFREKQSNGRREKIRPSCSKGRKEYNTSEENEEGCDCRAPVLESLNRAGPGLDSRLFSLLPPSTAARRPRPARVMNE
nr:unnamed protein product [Callosobruchus analis]